MRKIAQNAFRSGGLTKLSLLGVPEQVMIPVKYCLERGIFEKYGLDVSYTNVPEGTGILTPF
jgi:hypothetical protein